MTDKLLIEALEETRDTLVQVLIKIRRDAPDLSGKLLGHADQVIARVDALLDAPAHRSQQEAAQEPIGAVLRRIGELVDAWLSDKELITESETIAAIRELVAAPSGSEAKDAARYRWLREKERGVPAPAVYGPFTSLPLRGDELDEAIDAALPASGRKGEPT